jgi:hypothetical protein
MRLEAWKCIYKTLGSLINGVLREGMNDLITMTDIDGLLRVFL